MLSAAWPKNAGASSAIRLIAGLTRWIDASHAMRSRFIRRDEPDRRFPSSNAAHYGPTIVTTQCARTDSLRRSSLRQSNPALECNTQRASPTAEGDDAAPVESGGGRRVKDE